MNNKDRSGRLGNEPAAHERLRQQQIDALLEHLGQLLPPDQQADFRTASTTPAPPSLRLNSLVPLPAALLAALHGKGTVVPWCASAFVLDDREHRLGHTLEHSVGAVYVQAKAATLAVEALAPEPGERVLDLAAAPGGKATQIAGLMQNTGLLVVNELQSRRLPALVGNLERCGVANTVITRLDGNRMAQYCHNYFDRILLDAPCSGDGILRKDTGMLAYWSVADAQRQAQHQKGLLRAAFHMLKPGGTLVYSTCSLSLEENEDTLLGLLAKAANNLEILPIAGIQEQPLPAAFAGRYPVEFNRAVRVWPHRHDTEGAFVARLRKREATEWSKIESDAHSWDRAEDDPEVVTATADAVANVVERLEAQWDFSLPRAHSDWNLQMSLASKRNLALRPRDGVGFQTFCPGFVRAGMRVARRHRSHYFLTQQAVTMWGQSMRMAQLQLSWPQVRQLFSRGEVEMSVPDNDWPTNGEVICRYGPWALCRALVHEEGHRLDAMLPQAIMRNDLTRLADYAEDPCLD